MQIDNHIIYGLRLIVLIEDSPQSNNYRQVIFTNKEKLKKIGDVIWGGTPDGYEEKYISMSVDTYPLPDLQQIRDENKRYSPEY